MSCLKCQHFSLRGAERHQRWQSCSRLQTRGIRCQWRARGWGGERRLWGKTCKQWTSWGLDSSAYKKLGSLNANRTPNRGQLVSVMAQENLKSATILLHHRWTWTLVWKVRGVEEKTVCKLASQNELEVKYNDPKMLPKVNKANMTGIMEDIKEYLRSCHSVKRAHLVCVMRKTIVVEMWHLSMVCSSWWWNNCQDIGSTKKQNSICSKKMTISKKQQHPWQTTEPSMMYWIRSARIQTCICISKSTRQNKIIEGHFMLSTQGG